MTGGLNEEMLAEHDGANASYSNFDSMLLTCWLSPMKEKSEQTHIPHAPTLFEMAEMAVYTEWQFQALLTGNRTSFI